MSKLKIKIAQLFALAAAHEKHAASETLERGLILKAVWNEQSRKLIAARKGVHPSVQEIQILLDNLDFEHHIIGTSDVTPSGLHYVEILEVLPFPETATEAPAETTPTESAIPFKLDRQAAIEAILEAKGEREDWWKRTNSMDLLTKGLNSMTDQELALQYRRDVLRDFTGPAVLADRLWENLPRLDEALTEKAGRLLPEGGAA